MQPKFPRREAALVLLAGLGAAYALRALPRAPGSLIERSPIVDAVLTDPAAPAWGPRGADLTLAVFTDYQCPACRTSHRAMLDAVRRDGGVRILFKDWPVFGPASERAAWVALAAAYQGRYPAIHDALMTGGPIDEAAIRAAAARAGADWMLIERDLARHRGAIDRLLATTRLHAFALGLEGTPGYLAGRYLAKGAMGEEDFNDAFAAARAGRSA